MQGSAGLSLILILAACAEDHQSGGRFTRITDVLEEHQAADCEHLVRCHLFADQPTCLATPLRDNFQFDRLANPRVVAAVLSGKTLYNGSIVARCLDDLAAAACDFTDPSRRISFDECAADALRGTLVDGAACEANVECGSQFCSGNCNSDGVCCSGTCVGDAEVTPPPAVLFASCAVNGRCVPGAFCSSDAVCEPLLAEGAHCATSRECGEGLFCTNVCVPVHHGGELCVDDGVCADDGTVCASGVCIAVGLPGASCSTGPCSIYAPCDPTNRCAAYQPVGAACDPSVVNCQRGAFCDTFTDPATPRCAAQQPAGGVCSENRGCETLQCDSTTNRCVEQTCP